MHYSECGYPGRYIWHSGKKCTVIYYPLRYEKNCGFHIKKIVGDSLEDFVYINTDKPMANQIFVAVHELGHIYMVAENVIRIVRYDEFLLDEDDKKQYVEWFSDIEQD